MISIETLNDDIIMFKTREEVKIIIDYIIFSKSIYIDSHHDYIGNGCNCFVVSSCCFAVYSPTLIYPRHQFSDILEFTTVNKLMVVKDSGELLLSYPKFLQSYIYKSVSNLKACYKSFELFEPIVSFLKNGCNTFCSITSLPIRCASFRFTDHSFSGSWFAESNYLLAYNSSKAFLYLLNEPYSRELHSSIHFRILEEFHCDFSSRTVSKDVYSFDVINI